MPSRITFVGADGKTVGEKVLRVHVELRSALKLSRADHTSPVDGAGWSLIREAWAQEEKQVTVRREAQVLLDVRVKGAKTEPGTAQVEASCPPFTCIPVTPDANVPGQSNLRITVTATANQPITRVEPSPLKTPIINSAMVERARKTSGKAATICSGIQAFMGSPRSPAPVAGKAPPP